MADCKLISQGEKDGKTLYVCAWCKQPHVSRRKPEEIHRECVARPGKPTTDDLVEELQPDARKLLGDRIKDLTDALGIPTCGGCEARRQWLNKADAWIRERWG